ncbi:MAG TPA: NADH-quinone oxidoreductase subunit M [Chloroflexota bacterium]|nr:NADH-quinone oxidoreductase subunit M [Chloroflexota bacterium]
MPITTNTLHIPLLTIILLLPSLGAAICWVVPSVRLARLLAPAVAIIDFILSAFVLVEFHLTGSAWEFQLADRRDWIESLPGIAHLGITYWLGVDGVSVFLVVLTGLMMAIAIAAATFMITERLRAFLILMLFLETALFGVFMAINLFLFFVFWEAMLIPSYFLLGVWGEGRRFYATMKFLVYTIFGSFLMLVGIFYLWSRTGTLDMAGPSGLVAHPLDPTAQTWVFLAFTLAFAIKLPLFPLHSWAPDAYSESPVPFLIALAGIMSKAGAFGFIRYCVALFPTAAHNFQALISILAIIGMLYAAGLALVQTDIKRLVAYSSISHMNLIVLGIFALNATGIDGSVLQMINHSVIISGLFLAVAYITARTGTRLLPQMGGLGRRWPLLMWLFFVFVLAGLDLPGLGSFSGEFLILLGVFRENAWYASIAAVTVILAAWYMIRFFQDSMNGPEKEPIEPAAEPAADAGSVYQFPVFQRLIRGDLLPGEILLYVPLVLLILYLGVKPVTVTRRVDPTVARLVTLVRSAPSPGLGGGP